MFKVINFYDAQLILYESSREANKPVFYRARESDFKYMKYEKSLINKIILQNEYGG